MTILRKILRIRLILRIRIFVNMGPGHMFLAVGQNAKQNFHLRPQQSAKLQFGATSDVEIMSYLRLAVKPIISKIRFAIKF